MHVALVGTYPPVRCGIATFTADIESALVLNGVEVTVVSVSPGERSGRGIGRDVRSSYSGTAETVNELGCDVVLIEHEFGIFGGAAGAHVLEFTGALRAPYVVTLHTVLPKFSAAEAAVLAPLCAAASGVTVFTTTARRLLVDQALVSSGMLHIVAHGAPMVLYAAVDGGAVRQRFGLAAAGPVMSTFGLLSAGKGIEVAIRALARLVKRFPEIRYVIAGGTHPEVLRYEGEQYRRSLHTLVADLALEDHVVFLDRFLSVEDLADLLGITDVFCTPYSGADQIVSGALTFALAAGCAVVSTPYRYARDMLAGGAGLFADFGDSDGFADAVSRLLHNGPERDAAQLAAMRAAASLSWPSVGALMRSVLTASSTQPGRCHGVAFPRERANDSGRGSDAALMTSG